MDGTPKVAVNEPFKPFLLSFFRIILIIPAIPSASYRADGLVMTSILSIRSPCSILKASGLLRPTSPEGLPSTSIRTFELPRKLTFPSTSTATEGTLSSISEAFLPLLVRSLATLKTLLSRLNSICCFSADTTTSERVSESSRKTIDPTFTWGSFCETLTLGILFLW